MKNKHLNDESGWKQKGQKEQKRQVGSGDKKVAFPSPFPIPHSLLPFLPFFASTSSIIRRIIVKNEPRHRQISCDSALDNAHG
jgi:hypothetical protein